MGKSSKDRTNRQNFSTLEQHKRHGSKLLPPLVSGLGDKMSWTSWSDQGINDVLWAILIRGNLDQNESLDIFRKFLKNAHDNVVNKKETYLTHSCLALIDEKDFDTLILPLIADDKIREILSSILLIDVMPDKARWQKFLVDPVPERHSYYLMRAVAACLDHQSQESTDVRWLKFAYSLLVRENVKFPDEPRFHELIEELVRYPDYGDQRFVRPHIRASEIAGRGAHADSDGVTAPIEVPQSLRKAYPPPYGASFWKECFEKTPCIPLTRSLPNDENLQEHYIPQINTGIDRLLLHFSQSISTSDTDIRADSCFGIAMYASAIALGGGGGGSHQHAEGRALLRMLAEAFITIKYLVKLDNVTIWKQFRTYGVGQAKLAFLKNHSLDDAPNYLSIDLLELYINEDHWQEYAPIELRSWSDRNLRTMAIEAGVKDFYDKYYDWASGFVHGNWGAIRDTCFVLCGNPLHKHHRILSRPDMGMKSIFPDIGRILNSIYSVLDEAYPGFKFRLSHPSQKPRTMQPDNDGG